MSRIPAISPKPCAALVASVALISLPVHAAPEPSNESVQQAVAACERATEATQIFEQVKNLVERREHARALACADRGWVWSREPVFLKNMGQILEYGVEAPANALAYYECFLRLSPQDDRHRPWVTERRDALEKSVSAVVIVCEKGRSTIVGPVPPDSPAPASVVPPPTPYGPIQGSADDKAQEAKPKEIGKLDVMPPIPAPEPRLPRKDPRFLGPLLTSVVLAAGSGATALVAWQGYWRPLEQVDIVPAAERLHDIEVYDGLRWSSVGLGVGAIVFLTAGLLTLPALRERARTARAAARLLPGQFPGLRIEF